jgi:putative endonuclease
MPYIIYKLFSEKHQVHYTGFITNLAMRLLSHKEFGTGWTAKYHPWRIIFSKDFEIKNKAMAYEKWLKIRCRKKTYKEYTSLVLTYITRNL